MKKHLRSTLLLTVALAAASATHAESFSDNFQRATTSGQDKNSNPNAIGTVYTILGGKWNIADTSSAGRTANNLVGAALDAQPVLMYFNGFETLRNDNNQFSASMDVWAGGYGSNTRWQGMVFNLQDINNYYVFDYEVRAANSGVVRLGIVIGGTYTQLIAQSNVELDRSIYYRMTVTADSGNISVSMHSGTTELVTLASTNTQFLDGYAGFIRKSDSSVSFDNFDVETVIIPEASTVILVLSAAAGAMTCALRSRRKRAAA